MIKKVLKFFLFLFLFVFLAGAVFVGIQILRAPSLNNVDAVPEGYLTVIQDKDGNEIQTLHDSESNRVYVELSQIPEQLQNAFVAIEDARFYSHHGVDLKGMARAFFVAVKSGFKVTQGASTITQQLIKNNVLTSWTGENNMYDKVCRKIQEIYLSVKLEGKHDKAWILENYLNTINLGGGTRGVQTASQYYYGVDPGDLTLAQCALIAGITKNPNGNNPFKNPEASLERQHLVLKAMLDQDYITQDEYDEAMAEDVIGELDTDHENYASEQVFSYFEDALLEEVVDDLCEKYDMDEASAWNMIYSGGLTIQSTQDTDLQSICEEEVQDDSLYSSDEEVSVVMTDVSTGAVLAIVGGREEKKASLSYNRATDAERQPGSIIKIVGEYAAALDTDQLTLGSVFDDAAMTYSNGKSFKNAYTEYKGKITLRDAIACSSNTVAVMTYRNVGYDLVKDYLAGFGISTLNGEEDNEALAIGGTTNGVTTLEMTAAYNAIAAGGTYVKPYYYTTVTDHDGNVILANDATGSEVISEETASLLTSAMVSVMSEGTGTIADFSGMDLAGKSGTTNGNKDLWFVGYSPYYTCGVWGGYDDNREQTGSSYVKLLWKNIMEEAVRVKGYSYADKTFDTTTGMDSATICTKCGKLAVTGLCDSTVQGDMTRVEYYKTGTAPTEECDCHEAVTFCTESNMRASEYCPEEDQTTKVYLISGTEDTADEEYTIAGLSDTVCTVHDASWWNKVQKGLEEAGDTITDWGNKIGDWINGTDDTDDTDDTGNSDGTGDTTDQDDTYDQDGTEDPYNQDNTGDTTDQYGSDNSDTYTDPNQNTGDGNSWFW